MVRRLLRQNKHKLQSSKARQKPEKESTAHTTRQATCSEIKFVELYKRRRCKPRLNHIIIHQNSSPVILLDGDGIENSDSVKSALSIVPNISATTPTGTNIAPTRTPTILKDKPSLTTVKRAVQSTSVLAHDLSSIPDATSTGLKTKGKMANTQPVIIKMVASSTNRRWGPDRERITKLTKRQQCQRFYRRTKVTLSCLEGNTNFVV